MNVLKVYNAASVKRFISRRAGESKFGEKVNFISGLEDLAPHTAKYVLVGIPEDVGVRANQGKPGAANAWHACLKSLLNIQANQYTSPKNLILLGEIDCTETMARAASLGEDDPHYYAKLGDFVASLDKVVSQVITAIVSAGKIPIVIGGGHNNAFGNIKGTSTALKKPINIINIDAHSDLRKMDHRHSGNGFSYAQKEGYLGKYRMFGLHHNYTPAYLLEEIHLSSNNHYRLFEHLILKSSQDIVRAFREELGFVSNEEFGMELDCDAIKDFPSSAQSPSGFTFNMVRHFVNIASEEKNIRYLHLCEAAPSKNSETKVGKALSYLITDFMSKENV